MMENTTPVKNPLLETYGSIVDKFFSDGAQRNDPVFVFPEVISSSQVDTLPYKPDLAFFDPGEEQMAAIQKTVDNLRVVLEGEGKHAHQVGTQKRKFDHISDKVRAVRGQAEGIQQLHFHLDAFRKALQTGDESLLKGNPFYALAKLLFRLNLTGSVFLLIHLQEEVIANAPDRVRMSRSLGTIWHKKSRAKKTVAKLVESIGAFFGLSKAFLEATLFFISSFTTYRALDGLMQHHDLGALVQAYFSQEQAELLVSMLAVLGGGLLTVALLDWKSKMFQGMAEAGAVLSGIRTAFLISPRWYVLALCLALFSMKANYDSIATVFSKKEYLSAERERIHRQVHQALGTPSIPGIPPGPIDPASLHDLHDLLKRIVFDLSKRLKQVPEDEISGTRKGRGQDTRKGPQYWGKYFVVHGGFEPGVRDVVHAFRRVRSARNMDALLKTAGVPLDVPLIQRLEATTEKYVVDLERTDADIRHALAELDQRMRVGALSVETVNRVLSFDAHAVNANIHQIADAFVAHRTLFDRVIKEMDQLLTPYIALLAKIDRSDPERFRALRVQNALSTQKLPPAELFSAALIRQNDQKGLMALTAFMEERYGSTNGKLLMALILFLSFAVDGMTLLLFSRQTAKQGVSDAHVFPELLKYLKDWEDAFIESTKAFFYRPAIHKVFRGLTFPNETGVRNAVFKLLEEIDGQVKGVKDRTAVEQRRIWFAGLFCRHQNTRMTGYNARVRAIEILLSRKEHHFPRLIKRLFPGLPYDKKVQKILDTETFSHFFKMTEDGQAIDKDQFSMELKRVVRTDLLGDGTEPPHEDVQPNLISRVCRQLTQTVGRMTLSIPRRKTHSDVDQWTMMVQQASATSAPSLPPAAPRAQSEKTARSRRASTTWRTLRNILFEKGFMEAFEPFPHTRRNWLLEMSSINEKSLDDLDTLHDFIPDFVKMLKRVLTNTLPVIQESLDSLEDIYARFPDLCMAQGIMATSDLKNRFKEIEKDSLGMWGACISHLLGEEAVLTAHGHTNDTVALAGVLSEGGDISKFYGRINTLMKDAKTTAEKARAVEEAAVSSINNAIGDIKELCDEIGRMLVKVNILSLELRKRRPLPHAKIRRLNEHSTLLERAPREIQLMRQARDRIMTRDPLFVDENYHALQELKARVQALHSRVDGILQPVDT